MKKIIMALAAALCMVGCSLSPQEKQVSEALKQQLTFPESFKFISLDSAKTVTLGEQLDKRIAHFHHHYVINRALRFDASKDSLMEVRLTELRKQKADSLDAEAATMLKVRCNIKNDIGLPTDTLFYLWVTPKGDVVSVGPDSTILADCPVDFVDYIRIFNETLMKRD